MQFGKLFLLLFACLAIFGTIEARRVRIRPRPVEARTQQPQESEELPESEISEEDNSPQSAIQYYNAGPRDNLPQDRVVLVSSDDDYNGVYGQPTLRPRAEYQQQRSQPQISASRSTTLAPRTKEQATKSPPVQTIRNYSKVNDDGSFTFGYEAADGSFKEETRGTDCVVRGKYGYIDPDGNKREFTYVSGNPCDPNNPEGHDSAEERENSEEDSREPENVPQNYPKQRPIRPTLNRPIQQTTTNVPVTTVFQNTYSQHSLQDESDEEEPEPIQVLQPQRPRINHPTSVRPLQQTQRQQPPQAHRQPPSEISIRQRPRITVSTTTSPVTLYQPQSVSITPRPTYRTPVQTLQTQPPATTYRPALAISPQPAAITYSKPSSRPTSVYHSPTPNSISSTTRRPIDFAAEFQKFQKENNVPLTTTTVKSTTPYKPYKPQSPSPVPQRVELPATSNPIYESQLIFDPSSGQYDSALYQQLPQTDGDFQLNHRIQPYVHQLNQAPAPQLISLEQLQQHNPIYRTRSTPAPLPSPFSQQIYEKERENLQVLNSQQLFQQQQELQHQQLHQDRIEAARKATQHQQAQPQPQPHRFQPQQQLQRPIAPPQTQGFYYIQQPSSGQIDAFLRGHNIDF